MVEFLALPAWNTPTTRLDAWVERFASLGHPARLARDGSGGTWIEVPTMRLRGFVVMETANVEAINFELSDPESATATLEIAADGLGWEIHPDDGSDEDDES